MIRFVLLLPCFVLPLLAVAAPVPKERPPAHPYFPAEVGMKWEYTREGSEKVIVAMEITSVTEKDGAWIVVQTAKFPPSTSTHDVKYRIDKIGVLHLESFGSKLDPPQLEVKANLKSGDKWTKKIKTDEKEVNAFETVVGESQQIETPAGKYTALPLRTRRLLEPAERDSTSWYAEGVGLVKAEASDKKSPPLVLSKFTPGKDAKK